MRRLAARSLRVVLCAVIVAVVAWSLAAIWIDGPKNRWLAAALCAVVAAGSLLPLVMVRPWWWGNAAAVVPFAIVLAWWLSIAPSNTRNWQPDVAQLPSAGIDGNLVTIRNVRNFAYPSPTAVSERWETRTYDLDQVEGFDMFLSSWGARGIAHTISSWEFSDGQHLAISIETRKQVGEEYSALLGFFRQYELYYVVADERDVIGVRAGPRQEDVHLYRIRGSPALARAMLLDYLAVGQPARARAPVVQRADPQLHDDHPSSRPANRRRESLRLAHPGQRLHRRAGLQARSDQHEHPVSGAAAAQRHHGARQGRRRSAGFLRAHPRRSARPSRRIIPLRYSRLCRGVPHLRPVCLAYVDAQRE